MNLNTKKLPLLAALLGLVALILRSGLFLLGRDEKGLLMPWHPLDLLCWAVTAGTLLICVLVVRKLNGSCRYSHNFSASVPAAIGAFALAGGIAVTVIGRWNPWSLLELIRDVCGVLSVPAMIWVGIQRRRGKQPFFGFYAAACVYLTLYAVSHYQTWCSRPQMQDYAFSMGGILLLTMFAYQQTAFDVGLGKRRMHLLAGLLAGFFCLAAVAGLEDIGLYLGGAIWALTNLCSLTPVTDTPSGSAPEAGQDNSHASA